MEDERNAMAIGHDAEEGRADAAQSEGEAEEEARHRAHLAGDELMRVNKDGGEGRGEDEPDDRAQDCAPEEIGVRKGESERRHAEDGHPNDSFAADAVTDRSAEKCAGGNGGEEDEEMQLRVPHREAEFLDEEKRVVAAHASEIEILRKNKHDQDA